MKKTIRMNRLHFSFDNCQFYSDSADQRSSVVSLAKQVGYTPRSATSSQATIDVVVNNAQVPLLQCQEEQNLQLRLTEQIILL